MVAFHVHVANPIQIEPVTRLEWNREDVTIRPLHACSLEWRKLWWIANEKRGGGGPEVARISRVNTFCIVVLARIRAIGKGTGFLFDQSANESQSTVRKPDSPLLSQKERLFDHFNLVATNFNSSRLINNWRGKIFPSKPIQSKFNPNLQNLENFSFS